MKYERYKSVDGSVYKAEAGKDGLSDNAMRDLQRVVKGSQKTEAKVRRLDTVSIELVTEDGWQEMDVAVIVEERDEYERLHTAIAALPPEQQTLIRRVYFEDVPVVFIAAQEGVTDEAIWGRLRRISKNSKNI